MTAPPQQPASAASGEAAPSAAAEQPGMADGRPTSPSIAQQVELGLAVNASISEADQLAIAQAQTDVNGLRSRRRPAGIAPLPAPINDADALARAAKRLKKKELKQAAKAAKALKKAAEQAAKLEKAQHRDKPAKKRAAKASKDPPAPATPAADGAQKRKADTSGDGSEKRQRRPRIDVTISLTGDVAVARGPKPPSLQAASKPKALPRPAPTDLATTTQPAPKRPARAISPPRRSPSPEPSFPTDASLHGRSSSAASSAEQRAALHAHDSVQQGSAGNARGSRPTVPRRSPFPLPGPCNGPPPRLPAGRPEGWASDEAAFVAAVPTFPEKKDVVFVSPGLYARSLLLDPRQVRVDSWPEEQGKRISRLKISIKVTPRLRRLGEDDLADARLEQLQFALGDQTVSGALLKSQQHQSQVSVFVKRGASVAARRAPESRPSKMAIARRPPDYDPTQRPGASASALPVQPSLPLPCTLPPDVAIAMVGRFVVASSELCQEGCGETLKLQLDWDDAPENFWLRPAAPGEPEWSPAASPGAFPRRAALRGPLVFVDPPTVQSQGAFGSPVPLLCSAVRCLRCGEVIVRRHWKGWRCERCNIEHKALRLLVARDFDFGRMRIEYSGPRMDNGKAMWQSGNGVQRALEVWDDHVKSARYDVASAGQPGSRLWHLLSSGSVKAHADYLLQELLKARVPYRRHLLDGVLSPFFTAAFHGTGSSRTENFLRIPYMPLDEVRACFFDAVFAVDKLVRRCSAQARPYNEAAFLVIAGMSQDVPLQSCVGSIVHFGSDLNLILSRPGPPKPSATESTAQPKPEPVLSLVVAHGDVVCLEDAQQLGAAGYKLTLKSSALGVTVICGRMSA